MTITLFDLGLATNASQGSLGVSGLATDHREVKPGALFAALPGARLHGAQFAIDAILAGATSILTDRDGAAMVQNGLAAARTDGRMKGAPDPVVITAEDPRATLSYAAALFFGAQPPVTVAVTGTNGKTSVSTFVRQLWQLLGERAINLGTTGIEGDYNAPLRHTTPDPLTLHRHLAHAVAHGVTHCAMEASSHGLDQRRLDGVSILVGGFTNFTQDHLDYHKTFEDYFNAKALLFKRLLPEDGIAVINIDDPRGADLAEIAEDRELDIFRVGRSAEADFRLMGQRFTDTGQDLRLDIFGEAYQLHLPLIGGFQAENVLMAAAMVVATGFEPAQVVAVLPKLDGVRGRMQLAATRANGAAVYVDYAHTPDAIEKALAALRPHVMGRLVAIIGAGGDRDPGKRILMGAAAAKGADDVIVTDDNPRSEDPALIRAAVMQGCPDAREIGDRAEAILRAVDGLGPGDALLVMGKGHESGQTIGTDTYPFDDVEQSSLAVAALEGRV